MLSVKKNFKQLSSVLYSVLLGIKLDDSNSYMFFFESETAHNCTCNFYWNRTQHCISKVDWLHTEDKQMSGVMCRCIHWLPCTDGVMMSSVFKKDDHRIWPTLTHCILQACVAIALKNQKEAEEQARKEMEERKRKSEEKKRVKRMLDAAFDGDIDEINVILREVGYIYCCVFVKYDKHAVICIIYVASIAFKPSYLRFNHSFSFLLCVILSVKTSQGEVILLLGYNCINCGIYGNRSYGPVNLNDQTNSN